MTTLAITRGYPGSGKTTRALQWVNAKPSDRARVNRDDLRHALYGRHTGLTYEQEQAVTKAQHAATEALLRTGRDVVIDDTNLRLRNARSWADLAVRLSVDFEVWDITTTVDEAIARDEHRGMTGHRNVGADVISNFAGRYPQPWPEVKPTPRQPDDAPARYVPDPNKPEAIIVDLDGTLARNVTGREFYGVGLDRVYEDDVVANVRLAVARLSDGPDEPVHIVFMSGRNERARAETTRWLLDKTGWNPAGDPTVHLFMRADGDTRPDYIVKAELFDHHVRETFHVLWALDDRDQVVKLWRAMGLTCFQVAEGTF
ncbi:AAA family ATPase [Xylanimonas protaetiae]|uniref:Polynucleotide kinase PNKP phosphatase domain-containing protein n=1 Tax=Xylanimonas protaetiae TaxID=2509457 RepID=A0A4P6F3X3_9MICO|nr:AAA family ATPase [Xylanimonas protaetiae]QAY70026.1 hypothetical protein ET471_08250 [Xylanimonas protaetiae]